MHPFIHFFNLVIPSYGVCIALGLLLANLMAFPIIKKYKLDSSDFILVETYGFALGFCGAKLLYVLVNLKALFAVSSLSFSRFQQMISGGFVFYGGIAGGVAGIYLCRFLHKVDIWFYIKKCLFMLPFVHGFGRLGCFFAGCCYGCPWDGPFAFVFPENSFGLAGVPLFPVQLVEAIFLFILALLLFALSLKNCTESTDSIYLLYYGILRFVLEYFRYDSERGFIFCFSVSQWISIVLVIWGLILIFRRYFLLK